MGLSARQERLVREAEALEDETVGFLRELIGTDSVNPPGDYAAIHDLLETTFEGFGWETETVWAPDDLLAEHGLEHPRPNVLAYATRGDGPTIALVAHLDTVPVDEADWTYDPFAGEVDDGKLYGRGAKDCKGRIAAYTLAARALEEAGLVPDDATVVVAATADEEIGSAAGAQYLAESGALDADYVVVEGNVDAVWNAGAGVLNFEVRVTGKASHAGMYPEDGANAILSAARILTGLEAFAAALDERESEVPGLDGPTCVPATIEGGVKTNVVPPSCTVEVDMRVPPDYDVDDLAAEFEAAVMDAPLLDGTSVEVERTLTIHPYHFDADSTHIRAIKRNADAVLDADVPITGIRGSTDARHFALQGAKCANYGPGDDESNIHGADENVVVDQLTDAGAVLAASILDIVDEEA